MPEYGKPYRPKKKPQYGVATKPTKMTKRKPSGENNLKGGMSGRAESAIRQRHRSNNSALALARKHTK